MQAGLLIILSDVDGLYAAAPKRKKFQKKRDVIPIVEEIGPRTEKMASASISKLGTGGMVSKIEAAKICSTAGVSCIVANGRVPDILRRIVDGENIGTLFLPKAEQLVAKKRWIGFSAKISGQIFVDQGAKQALISKKRSLLPKGIVKIRGTFVVGDTVSILDVENKEFGRGLSSYSSEELAKIKGYKSDQIKTILGYKYYDEVVHRDNLVIL
jgi:glutamate 5-kinase